MELNLTNKRRNDKNEENLKFKKLKVEGMNEVKGNDILTSPPNSVFSENDEKDSSNEINKLYKKFNKELYDLINEENEQVARFFEKLFRKREKGESLWSMIEIENLMDGDSLMDIVYAMYKRFKTFEENEFKKNKKYNNIEIYIDLNELTRDERKLLMIGHNINNPSFYNLKEEKYGRFTCEERRQIMDKELSSKITFCACYAPYDNYVDFIFFSKYPIRLNPDYFFNYESLTKLNICCYYDLLIYDDEDGYFNANLSCTKKLGTLVNYFYDKELYKIDKELYNRFIKLYNKFPKKEIDFDFDL